MSRALFIASLCTVLSDAKKLRTASNGMSISRGVREANEQSMVSSYRRAELPAGDELARVHATFRGNPEQETVDGQLNLHRGAATLSKTINNLDKAITSSGFSVASETSTSVDENLETISEEIKKPKTMPEEEVDLGAKESVHKEVLRKVPEIVQAIDGWNGKAQMTRVMVDPQKIQAMRKSYQELQDKVDSMMPTMPMRTYFDSVVDAATYCYPALLGTATFAAWGEPNIFVHDKDFGTAIHAHDHDHHDLDAVFSSAYLDLSQGPLIFSVPDVGDQYYMAQVMSHWTDVVESIGTRTTGNEAGSFLIVPESWQGETPQGLTLVTAPTNVVFITVRQLPRVAGEEEAMKARQNQFTITTLKDYQQNGPWDNVPVIEGQVRRRKDDTEEESPSDQVKDMDADKLFTLCAGIMAEDHKALPANLLSGHSEEDPEMVRKFNDIGVVVGANEYRAPSSELKKALTTLARHWTHTKLVWESVSHDWISEENGWSLSAVASGDFGDNYLARAASALVAVGSSLKEDVMYANHKIEYKHDIWKLHLQKPPPVDGSWSLSMYNHNKLAVENQNMTYSLGSRNAKANKDGSIDIFIAPEAKFSQIKPPPLNFLPAPARDPWRVVMGMYGPQEQVWTNGYKLPPMDVWKPRDVGMRRREEQ